MKSGNISVGESRPKASSCSASRERRRSPCCAGSIPESSNTTGRCMMSSSHGPPATPSFTAAGLTAKRRSSTAVSERSPRGPWQKRRESSARPVPGVGLPAFCSARARTKGISSCPGCPCRRSGRSLIFTLPSSSLLRRRLQSVAEQADRRLSGTPRALPENGTRPGIPRILSGASEENS